MRRRRWVPIACAMVIAGSLVAPLARAQASVVEKPRLHSSCDFVIGAGYDYMNSLELVIGNVKGEDKGFLGAFADARGSGEAGDFEFGQLNSAVNDLFDSSNAVTDKAFGSCLAFLAKARSPAFNPCRGAVQAIDDVDQSLGKLLGTGSEDDSGLFGGYLDALDRGETGELEFGGMIISINAAAQGASDFYEYGGRCGKRTRVS